MAENYRDLIAWQKAKALALEIYRCTRMFPKDEVYELSVQMRRSAVSVPSNIAEGKGRHSTKELPQFLYRARGSLLELETQLAIAGDLELRPSGNNCRTREDDIGTGANLKWLN